MFILVLFFFFKQKTAYEMRISDWSSDVCSSDLAEQPVDDQSHVRGQTHRRPAGRGRTESLPDRPRRGALALQAPRCTEHPLLDELRRALHQRNRKSVVEGKSGSVRVELGCRRIIKKKTNICPTTVRKKKT